jgi:hypothetical protein
MPNVPGNIWTIILWVVLAILAVFLFQNIVLPLLNTVT